MDFEYSHSLKDQIQGDSFEESIKIRLQLFGQYLIESKDIILGAMAWKGWIEHGRCLVTVHMPTPDELSQDIEFSLGIMAQDSPGIKLVDASEIITEYNPERQCVLVVCDFNQLYFVASVGVFTPSLPPEICYEEIIKRPEEFDFSFV
ncbi:MAG TPA: hypothetical protein V6D12_22885 [Candidatus Obscuribacterales bacterium]